jgi:hypothetical protein
VGEVIARVRGLTQYKQFIGLWKDANLATPIYQAAKTEYAKLWQFLLLSET